jgi:predicted dehydrogenase
MVDRLRVGLVGCGAIAQIMHIPYLLDYDDYFDLAVISDSHKPVLDDVGERYHIERRYTDWRELLTQDDLDAVLLCHSGSHRDTVIAAVDAGKHVLVEKPLAWNIREGEEIAAHVAGSDRIVQVAYHKLYDPSFAPAREEVQGIDDLGFARITVLHPTNELGFSPYRIRRGDGQIDEGHLDPGTWDRQVQGQLRAFAGGDLSPLVDEALGARKDDPRLRLAYGLITVSLIHQIYMLHGLLGDPLRVIDTQVWREGMSIHAVIEYPNEARCTLDWHYLSHLKDYREEYLFCGNHRRVRLEFPGPYYRNFPSPLTVQDGEGEMNWEKRIVFSLDEAFRNELLAFHACVTQGKPPRTTVQDGLHHLRFGQQLIDAAT